MSRSNWISRLCQPLKVRKRQPQKTAQNKFFRPQLERLEARTLLSANNYNVNLTGDAGTGSGTSGDIRYCITQADLAANAGSTITFASSLSGQTIALTNGQLAITDNMTITGLGPTSLTISAGGLSRVFDISAKSATISISSLTISGGSLAGEGGGIYNAGTLTLSDDTLSGNSAKYGGGIFTVSGVTLTVSSSSLSGNSATYGGGIFNKGSLTVSAASLTGNSASSEGGGILDAGSVSVTASSTLSTNDAIGGGVYNSWCLTLSDDTLSGNSASYGGGAGTPASPPP